MLGILSVLNWLMGALYLVVLLVIFLVAGEKLPFEAFGILTIVLCVLALPHLYLGLRIEQGKGRILQTIFAVLALPSFPIGTLYGAFALWVVWSAEAEVFELGGVEHLPPPTKTPRKKTALEEHEPEPDYVSPVRPDSPFALVKELKAEGYAAVEIQEALDAKGLGADEIATVMGAAGVKYSHAAQRSLDAGRAKRAKRR